MAPLPASLPAPPEVPPRPKYNLPQEFHHITSFSTIEWKNKVKKSVEELNKNRLHEDCHTNVNGTMVRKSKTAHIIDRIENPSYQRKPLGEILQLNKKETKTLIIARFRMLECGRNFKGTMKDTCDTCGCVDDEEHRLNICIRFTNTNYRDDVDQIKFDTIFWNVKVNDEITTRIGYADYI